jgi:hypothetical protein
MSERKSRGGSVVCPLPARSVKVRCAVLIEDAERNGTGHPHPRPDLAAIERVGSAPRLFVSQIGVNAACVFLVGPRKNVTARAIGTPHRPLGAHDSPLFVLMRMYRWAQRSASW